MQVVSKTLRKKYMRITVSRFAVFVLCVMGMLGKVCTSAANCDSVLF